MEKIIEKIEVYHFINYLLPGIIFGTIFTEITQKNFFNDNIILAIIEYYFVGLVLSRIGSIIIKPILEKLKIITCAKYSQYIISIKYGFSDAITLILECVTQK